MIPRQLVESSEGSAYVWVADLTNKVAHKQAVKVGRASGDFVEITQGLNPSDRLIVDGRNGLSDGQRIAPTHVDAGPESIRTDGPARPKHTGKH
jgi:multidrug efflux pump subunit AcrA (membrane-fusion protein)